MKKFLFSVSFIFLCLLNNCQCPPERYFDYKSLKVEVNKDVISPNEKLIFRINVDEVVFLAKERLPQLFAGYAYATSVCEKGYGGEKYPITNIHISSESDFDEEHLAGDNLIDLIKVYGADLKGNYVFDYLKKFPFSNINPWYLYIEDRPTISKNHIFIIQFEKSNGEVAIGKSIKITWE